MRIAYVINQYPQPSQSFMRREIRALETLGVTVDRFTVRRWPGKLVDPGDQAESQNAHAILDAGANGLVVAIFSVLSTAPGKFFRGLRLAVRVGRRSDRGILLHL